MSPARICGALLLLALRPGSPISVIAHFTGVDVDAAGRVYVIDSARGTLSVHSSSGERIASAEIQAGDDASLGSASVSVSPSGEIYIAVGRMISGYALGNRVLTRRTRFPVAFDPRDICASSDALYVLGYERDTVVHAFSSTGRVLRSFGAPPTSPSALARNVLSEGRLACDDRGVTVALLYRPQLTRYTSRGERAWTATIPAFASISATVDASGMLMLFPPDHGYDGVVSLVAAGDTLIADIARRKELNTADAAITSVREVRFAARDGRVLRDEVAAPIAAIRSGWSARIAGNEIIIARVVALLKGWEGGSSRTHFNNSRL